MFKKKYPQPPIIVTMWYEDRNFFAKPIYDCKYWCDIPELPDLGNKQFGTEVSADMRGDKE